MAQVTGLHHVTAIAGDAQENVDFYSGVLGMRLVKKSVVAGLPALRPAADRVLSARE